MHSWERHVAVCGSVRRNRATASPGNGPTTTLSPNIFLDQLPVQPPNSSSALTWLRKSINAKATTAAGSSSIAAKITAAAGATCAIAATAQKFAGTANVTKANRELRVGGLRYY